MLFTQETDEEQPPSYDSVGLFDDFEARSNIVGLFDLLLRIDRRTRPELYHD